MTAKSIEKILDDPVALLRLSRKGIKYSLFESIVNSGPFAIKEWVIFLHLTERTLQRYKKENRSFEQLQSSRILKIAQLQTRGKDIFDGVESYAQWMNSKIVAMGGIKPIDLLDNSFGIAMLNEELTRIEYGVLA